MSPALTRFVISYSYDEAALIDMSIYQLLMYVIETHFFRNVIDVERCPSANIK